MKEYKSSLFIIGKNIVYAAGGMLVAALVLSWFLSDAVAIALGILTGLAIAYFAVYADNIRVVVDDDNLSVWRFGKQLHQFAISECGFSANIRTTSGMIGGDSDCMLTVIESEGNETAIDCSMLGATRFYALLDTLGVTDPEPAPLATQKN